MDRIGDSSLAAVETIKKKKLFYQQLDRLSEFIMRISANILNI